MLNKFNQPNQWSVPRPECTGMLHASVLCTVARIQKFASIPVIQRNPWWMMTPMHHSFHWLLTELSINYKLYLLCFEIISHQAPIYLFQLLHLYTPSWQLHCSAASSVFRIPSFLTKCSGQRSFSYQASAIWNQPLFPSVILPLSVLLNLSWKHLSFS